MAVCCQNLTLGAISSRSALSMLVGALFKKFGLFLNTPRTTVCIQQLVLIFFVDDCLLSNPTRTTDSHLKKK